MLLATHNPEEALELCDRLAVLHQGELLAAGTVPELRALAGDDAYRAWVRVPEGWSIADLRGREGAHEVTLAPGDETGWRILEFKAPGGPDQAARLLSILGEAGVQVSRFEPIQLTLAELMERILAMAPETSQRTSQGQTSQAHRGGPAWAG